MKIALVNSCQPFVYGGAEFLVDTLESELINRGHFVEKINIPFHTQYNDELFNTIIASRSIQLAGVDKVIAFKFPAYFIRHPNKTLWVLHQFRQVYDLWSTQYGLKDNLYNRTLKKYIQKADNEFLCDVKNIFTISNEVTNRLLRYNSIKSEVLYPPLKDSDQYYSGEYGDYIFYPSRITALKRQHLAIEAMRYTKTKVRLIIAGKADDSSYEAKMKDFIKTYQLETKVQLLGWISQKEKFDLMSSSLACAYIPYMEDYGFVTLEAFYSKKPVITLNDSGCVREFVFDDITGYVVDDAKEIAKKFDYFYENRKIAERMGRRAFDEISSRNLSWESSIERLLL